GEMSIPFLIPRCSANLLQVNDKCLTALTSRTSPAASIYESLLSKLSCQGSAATFGLVFGAPTPLSAGCGRPAIDRAIWGSSSALLSLATSNWRGIFHRLSQGPAS